ncbi:hypothetical protein ACSBQ3_13035 [Staphylococcus equorum]|uniref:hypothetical protein n=1 Tax=Staphylococcus equorum TaxID=246432 RepID=UPI0021C13F4A|nr:hypothetical protein [Staphylococcus equorum]
MYRKKPIKIINRSFILLLIALYVLLILSVTHSDIYNPDIRYVVGIALAFFFGQPMKSIYNFIFNNHFNYSESIPNEFISKQTEIHILIDIFSLAATVFLLALFSSNIFLISGCVLFVVCFSILGVYSIFSSDHYKKI